jgi:hypothetical protein
MVFPFRPTPRFRGVVVASVTSALSLRIRAHSASPSVVPYPVIIRAITP